jgi:hypothetical protein
MATILERRRGIPVDHVARVFLLRRITWLRRKRDISAHEAEFARAAADVGLATAPHADGKHVIVMEFSVAGESCWTPVCVAEPTGFLRALDLSAHLRARGRSYRLEILS